MPAGPGWTSLLISLALLAGVLAGFFHVGNRLADRRYAGREPSPPVEVMEVHAFKRAVKAHLLKSGVAGDGMTENFNRWLPHDSDGVIEPLWPWMMASLLAGDEASYEQTGIGREGARRQLWTGAVLIGLLGLGAARSVSPPLALALMLGAAVVLLPLSVYFLPGMLYAVLIFLCWACAWELLRRNSVWMHGIFGVLCGLAWLTNSSGWILPAAWLAASGVRWVISALTRGEGGDEAWTGRNHFIGLVAFALGWLAMAGPRCVVAQEKWGNPVFAWPQHWMWLNQPQAPERLLAMAAQPHAAGQLPANLPGSDSYTARHSGEEAWGRFKAGWREAWGKLLAPAQVREEAESSGEAVISPTETQRGWYLGGALVILVEALVLYAVFRRTARGRIVRLERGTPAVALFVLLAGAGYGAWAAWMEAVSPADRLTGYVYLPLFFSMLYGAHKLIAAARAAGAWRGHWWFHQALATALCAAMLLDFAEAVDRVPQTGGQKTGLFKIPPGNFEHSETIPGRRI